MTLTSFSPKGESWDVAMFAPTCIVTDEDIDEIVRRNVVSVKAFTKELRAEGIL